MVLCGSANCTGAGLGVPGAPKNIELSVTFGDRDARELKNWLPDLLRLPKGKLTWANPDAEEAIDSSYADRLPGKFHEVLYHPATNTVAVEIDQKAPPHHSNISTGNQEWFSSDAHDSQGSLVRFLGRGEAPPLELTVRWSDQNDDERSATMVVSVAELDALPAPPELAGLDLDDILELLAAGSRYRAALRGLLAERAGNGRGGHSSDIELDPHAKVDTSAFVLQRMRRAGKALEVLRERLERPVSNRDAVNARITRARIGPRALVDTANAAVEAGTMTARERSFLLAELILTLHRVEWAPVGPEVKKAWCVEQAAALIAELASLPPSGDAGIDRYFKTALAAG